MSSEIGKQKRADQIGLFLSELARIEQTKVLSLSEKQEKVLEDYYVHLVGQLVPQGATFFGGVQNKRKQRRETRSSFGSLKDRIADFALQFETGLSESENQPRLEKKTGLLLAMVLPPIFCFLFLFMSLWRGFLSDQASFSIFLFFMIGLPLYWMVFGKSFKGDRQQKAKKNDLKEQVPEFGYGERDEQVRAFQDELALLEREKVLVLSHAQRSALTAYQYDILSGFSWGETDACKAEKRFDWKTGILGLFGAIGLVVIIFFLFYLFFWKEISLEGALYPYLSALMITLGMTVYVYHRGDSAPLIIVSYMLCAFCLYSAFFPLPEFLIVFPNGSFASLTDFRIRIFYLVLFEVFTFSFAYLFNRIFFLILGIFSFSVCLLIRLEIERLWSNEWWNALIWVANVQAEKFFPFAILLAFLSYLPHEKFPDFKGTYRLFALLFFFLPALFLANWASSFLLYSAAAVQSFYQGLGLFFSALAFWFGRKKNWPEVMYTGIIFFVLFLVNSLR